MKVIDPGHVYELTWLDLQHPLVPYEEGEKASYLTFVKREGPDYPGNVGHHPGTTLQEVLRVLIDRVKYLDQQIPHPRNQDVLASLRRAIFDLEIRAAERHHRLASFYGQIYKSPFHIEEMSTCRKCLHIGCDGRCH